MTYLKNLYDDGKPLPLSMTFRFRNRELVNFEIESYEELTIAEFQTTIDRLIEKHLIKFHEDVTNMMVNINIDVIGVGDLVFIESYHYDLDDENKTDELHNRDSNIVLPLHSFLGIDKEIYSSDLV